MASRTDALLLFDALSIEGGLLPPEWLAKVAALQAPLQEPKHYGVPKGLELRVEVPRCECAYTQPCRSQKSSTVDTHLRPSWARLAAKNRMTFVSSCCATRFT
jgi:hypothetical protein